MAYTVKTVNCELLHDDNSQCETKYWADTNEFTRDNIIDLIKCVGKHYNNISISDAGVGYDYVIIKARTDKTCCPNSEDDDYIFTIKFEILNTLTLKTVELAEIVNTLNNYL